jgi:hypothetical protein
MKMCLIAKNLSISQNKIISVNIWVLQNYKEEKATCCQFDRYKVQQF